MNKNEQGDDMELTQREQQVLALAAKGLSNPEIAGELGIANQTVKQHMWNVYTKVEIPGDRVRLVLWALENGYGVDENGVDEVVETA